MKQVHTFVFCEGTFSANIVWYYVLVGTSKRDQVAHLKIKQLAEHNNSVLYSIHSRQIIDVQARLAAAVFSDVPRPSILLRTKFVQVQELARFIRKSPLALLNSDRVPTFFDIHTLILSGAWSSAAIQSERYKARKQYLPSVKRNKPKYT